MVGSVGNTPPLPPSHGPIKGTPIPPNWTVFDALSDALEWLQYPPSQRSPSTLTKLAADMSTVRANILNLSPNMREQLFDLGKAYHLVDANGQWDPDPPVTFSFSMSENFQTSIDNILLPF